MPQQAMQSYPQSNSGWLKLPICALHLPIPKHPIPCIPNWQACLGSKLTSSLDRHAAPALAVPIELHFVPQQAMQCYPPSNSGYLKLSICALHLPTPKRPTPSNPNWQPCLSSNLSSSLDRVGASALTVPNELHVLPQQAMQSYPPSNSGWLRLPMCALHLPVPKHPIPCNPNWQPCLSSNLSSSLDRIAAPTLAVSIDWHTRICIYTTDSEGSVYLTLMV